MSSFKPRVVRNLTFLWRFESVAVRELQQLLTGNCLLGFSIEAMFELALINGFGVLEHPAEPDDLPNAASNLEVAAHPPPLDPAMGKQMPLCPRNARGSHPETNRFAAAQHGRHGFRTCTVSAFDQSCLGLVQLGAVLMGTGTPVS